MQRALFMGGIALLRIILGRALGLTGRKPRNGLENFPADDAEMNAAQAEAREHLPKFLSVALDDEGVSKEGCLVKVAFHVGGTSRVEVIWVGPFRELQDGGFAGALENDSVDMPGLSACDEVRFSLDMIQDWRLLDGTGRAYGHFTTRVIAATTTAPRLAERIAQIVSETPVPADW